MATNFYILGTLKRPAVLIRRESSPFTVERLDPYVDEWFPDFEAGRWIVLGDTMLTDITPEEAKVVRARLRVAARGSEAVSLD